MRVMDVSASARLVLAGKDAAAFIHRLSTQHVKDLRPGDARLNVLCTDKGRIKDLVHHVVLDDGRVLLVGYRTDTDALHAWLDRYCFSEDVAFSPLAGGAVLVDRAAAVAVSPRAADLAPWAATVSGTSDDVTVVVRTFDHLAVDGPAPTFIVLGAGAPAAGSNDDFFDAALIAAGAPLAELNDAHTPLDLALHDAIHWAKGCYIGQEVIARLDTYGKQRKRLVSVVTDANVSVGDAIVVGDAVVGAVTSVARAPSAGLPRANALVKLPATEAADAVPCDARVRTAGVDVASRLVERRCAQAPHD